MRIITTQQDLNMLRRAKALLPELLDLVEDYFNQQRVELEDEDRSEFRLDMHGYIVVLEAGDNVRDLGNVGLPRPAKRLSKLVARFSKKTCRYL